MSTLKIFGNVSDVLEGKVTPSNLLPVEEGSFRFALGGSSFSDERCVGETLFIEGIPHISWVQDKALLQKSGGAVRSSFLVGIDFSQISEPPVSQKTSIALGSLYENLLVKYPMGFAMIASFKMAQFSATYLKKAPIYGENVNDNHAKYWADVELHEGVYICLFGVAIPQGAMQDPIKNKWAKRAFYQNPGEKISRPFLSHTHAAIVDRLADSRLKDLSRLKVVAGVRHTLTDSVVQEGHFLLFPLH